MMLNVKMKASDCERTGFVAHICRNKVPYISGVIAFFAVSGFATYWFCYRVNQDVKEGVFAKMGGTDAEFATFLDNKDVKGNDKAIQNICSKYFKVNGGKIEGQTGAKLMDLMSTLKSLKNDKIKCSCSWYDSIKDEKDKSAILAKLTSGTDIYNRLNSLA